MKKIFKKNQIIITALAIMIAAAGYISYSDSKLDPVKTSSEKKGTEATEETVDMDSVLQDIESLDEDITEEMAADSAEEGTETANVEGEIAETETDISDSSVEAPGEAVLTGASTYMAQARISREQIRSQNKETLLEIINNGQLSQEERQSAIDSMVSMTDLVEKEAARCV